MDDSTFIYLESEITFCFVGKIILLCFLCPKTKRYFLYAVQRMVMQIADLAALSGLNKNGLTTETVA